MVTIRYYNKKTNKLNYKIKSIHATAYPEDTIKLFARLLTERSKSEYTHYIACAKDRKIIAREAKYKGV